MQVITKLNPPSEGKAGPDVCCMDKDSSADHQARLWCMTRARSSPEFLKPGDRANAHDRTDPSPVDEDAQ
ncbi:hypothetical protein N7512_004105 [Penicillium capsulatum]|nr:hypothetical protein N7512_004105 [Penicillium capsulatum]